MACLFLSPLAAHAGTYSAPVYSASDKTAPGQVTVTDSTNPNSPVKHPYIQGSTADSVTGNLTYGGGNSDSCGPGPNGESNSFNVAAAGTITAKFTWQPAPGQTTVTDPPPVGVVVVQHCQADWLGGGSGTFSGAWDSGLGPSGTGQGGTYATLYTKQAPAGDGSVSVTCSPSASINGVSGQSGSVGGGAGVSYSAGVTPVTITLGGAVKDGSGNYHILIGQQCVPTLSVAPDASGSSFAGTITSLKWKATGNTVQSNSWVIATGDTSATFSGPVNPYTFTQATQQATGPSWYWDDSTTSQTVTCTATVTPPSGQGAAFTVTVTQKVTLDTPTYTNSELPGSVQLDSKYRPAPGVLALHASLGADNVPGIIFSDTVTTPSVPTLYSGTGYWFHLQLISISRYRAVVKGGTAVGILGNQVTGALDSGPEDASGVTYVYGHTFSADGKDGALGTSVVAPDNDSPSQELDPVYQEYNIKGESFHDYIIYSPPGNSIAVPLADYTWSWNVDVTTPPTWANWGGAPTGGTITPPGSNKATRQLTYPKWPSLRNFAWPAK